MSGNGNQEYTPVIFVDTNAVHYSRLALAFAAKRGIDVLVASVDSFKDQLRNKRVGAVEHYIKGYWILRYLKKRSEEGALLLYSPITQLELLCGSLRGEAIKRAAKAGAPNRWFSRVPESEIRDHLEPDGYTRVRREQDNADSLFEHAGITLNRCPVEREVWEIAQTVMENVFIDVQDCLLYASAIVNQASELVTIDGYLRDTAGWTHDPGTARDSLKKRFQSVQKALINAYATMTGCNKNQVVVPKPKGIPQIRQCFNGGTA